MNINESGRAWLCAMIATLSVILIIWLAPTPIYTPKGIVLPTKEARAPISPTSVQFYVTAPLKYQTLGTINIERFYTTNIDTVKEQIQRYAMQLAASVGANGVLVQQSYAFAPSQNIPAAQAMFQLRGLAIYTNEQPASNLSPSLLQSLGTY